MLLAMTEEALLEVLYLSFDESTGSSIANPRALRAMPEDYVPQLMGPIQGWLESGGTVNGVNMIGLALQGPTISGLTLPSCSSIQPPKKETDGSTSLAVVPRVGGGALVAPAPLEPRAATIGNVSLLLPLQPRLLTSTSDELTRRTILEAHSQPATSSSSINPSSID
ncbi:hypothetical protein GE061_013796 [Apolygus lucorum]|uniref:Uncharacterized protein n=1 Tax=Apolygus lucorum TaxID=248454 RepID=A0A8S9XQ11_APOLU|nr:hypothetical protein GE061_013796 [Apolygus lucorum]